jgi:hypothetical protein
MSPRHRREVALGAGAAAVLSGLVIMLGGVLAGIVVFSAAPRASAPGDDGGSLLLPMRSAEAAAPGRVAIHATPRVAPVIAVTLRQSPAARASATVQRTRRTTLRPTRPSSRRTAGAPAATTPQAPAPAAAAAPSATTIAAPAPPAPAPPQPTTVASTTQQTASAPSTRRVAVTAPVATPVATAQPERPRRWDRRRRASAPAPQPVPTVPAPAPPAAPAPAPPQQGPVPPRQAPVPAPAPEAPAQGGRPWRPDGPREHDRGGHRHDGHR